MATIEEIKARHERELRAAEYHVSLGQQLPIMPDYVRKHKDSTRVSFWRMKPQAMLDLWQATNRVCHYRARDAFSHTKPLSIMPERATVTDGPYAIWLQISHGGHIHANWFASAPDGTLMHISCGIEGPCYIGAYGAEYRPQWISHARVWQSPPRYGMADKVAVNGYNNRDSERAPDYYLHFIADDDTCSTLDHALPMVQQFLAI